MKTDYDVIVAGAGYHGCACAYFLAKAGLRTLLIDKGAVGSGASGANFGNVQVQDCSPGLSYDLTLAGYERMKTMEAELQTSIGYRDRGSLLVADRDKYLPMLRDAYETKKAAGLPVRWLEGDRLIEEEPNLAQSGIRAASFCMEGNVYPFHYLYALVMRGREAGLDVAEDTGVKALYLEGGRCRGIVLENETVIHSGHVVAAAGAGTKELCRTAGLDIPVETVKAEGFATEAIGPFLRNYYSSAGFFAEAHNPERASVSLCISQSHYGNLLVAETTKPYHKVDPALSDCTSVEHVRELTAALVRIFPVLDGIRILRSWCTSSPYTADMLPYFGKSPVDGLLLAAGFKSSVVMSAVVGETIRDLVSKDACRYDLSEFTDRIKRIN